MDISGVQIGHDARLLTPEDGSRPRFYHRVAAEEWCETVLGKTALTGSWDTGDLASRKPIICSGGHVTGSIVGGQWIEEPTDG